MELNTASLLQKPTNGKCTELKLRRPQHASLHALATLRACGISFWMYRFPKTPPLD